MAELVKETKQCYTCKEYKPIIEFYRSKRQYDGLHSYCKPCDKIRRTQNNRLAVGIAQWQIDLAYEKQGGLCAICGNILAGTMNADHNHKTGKFRGLLCADCNRGMGHYHESVSLLLKAAEYLIERK